MLVQRAGKKGQECQFPGNLFGSPTSGENSGVRKSVKTTVIQSGLGLTAEGGKKMECLEENSKSSHHETTSGEMLRMQNEAVRSYLYNVL